MPVYHIGESDLFAWKLTTTTIDVPTALFKLREGADPEKIRQWQHLAHQMVGQVPGQSTQAQGASLLALDNANVAPRPDRFASRTAS
jgi:hypothetical protein